MKRIREKLSFSNLMALAAVFIALGGTAYAGAKIGSSQIKNGAVTGSKLSPKLMQWAFVDDTGAKIAGRGVQNSSRKAEGDYVVTFKNKVAGCGISATPDRLLPTEFAVATVLGHGASGYVTNNRQVEVNLGDTSGFSVDQDFYVTVLC